MGQKHFLVTFLGSEVIQKKKYKRITITLCENLTPTKPKFYIGFVYGILNIKSPLKTITRKSNGRFRIFLPHRKTTYTPLHGKHISEDTCLIFLLSILTLTLVILMKVTHGVQRLFLSLAPIFMTQVKVKTGKFAPVVTHLKYILEILNHLVKVKTLVPL